MILFLFLLGLSVGSFLNVLIDRLPKGESVIKGRSYCDHCHHKLCWYDLVPFFSFVLLKRRCRYCKKQISWQYPLVELTTGILFLLTYTLMIYITKANVFSPTFVYLLVVISGLIAIFFTDLKYRIIPDQIVFALVVISFIYEIVYQSNFLLNYFLSGVSMFLIFLTLVFITKGKGMGYGDVKFSFFMGIFLGFPKIMVAFYLSFLTGAVVSIILVIAGVKGMKSKIAFGPFLVIATFISFFYGEHIWSVFTKILGI